MLCPVLVSAVAIWLAYLSFVGVVFLFNNSVMHTCAVFDDWLTESMHDDVCRVVFMYHHQPRTCWQSVCLPWMLFDGVVTTLI